ncbi:hypothetical protein [Empedobacter tilapiae]
MIKIKTYNGYFTFDKKEYNHLRGYLNTYFELSIKEINNDKFSGTIIEDSKTGGIEGVGTVEGYIHQNNIYFIKRMPYLAVLTSVNKIKTYRNKKHPEILYQGSFDNVNNVIKGIWKTKFTIIWFGVLPIPFFPSKGSWQMEL